MPTDDSYTTDQPMRECGNCRHFAPLSPDHAAICFYKWRDLAWNAAVPLTTRHDSCEAFEKVAHVE